MAEVGDIVQVRPEAARWGGLLFVVSEVRSWGVVAYMQLPGPCEAIVTVVDTNQAWVRLSWAEFDLTGGKVRPII